MKNNNNNKEKVNYKKIPPWEKPLFLIIISFIGGYMNSYTYITRDEILANMHTANMSKFGISIALNDWQNAIAHFIPIIACILGATFSEYVKFLFIKNDYKGDWRKIALVLESIFLFYIGFLSKSVPNYIVTNLVSF